MLHSLLQNQYGQYYKLQTPSETQASLALQPRSFWNPELTCIFIRQLKTPHDYWHRVLQRVHRGNTRHLSQHQIHRLISQLLIDGKLHLYPVKPINPLETPPEKVTIKASGDASYRFADVSTLLLTSPKEVKRFASTKDAEAFINQLNPDKEQLKTIATHLEVPLDHKTASSADGISSAIAESLASGKAIIIVDRTSISPPPPEEPQENKSSVGNRKADLGGSSAAVAVVEASEKPCTLHKYTIQCSHSRTMTLDPKEQQEGVIQKLSVVSPSSNADKSKQETISVNLDLETPCAGHAREQVSVNQECASFIGPTYGKTVKIRTPSEPLDVSENFYRLLWLPSIKPLQYKICPSMSYCHTEDFDGKGKSICVDVYPEISWDLELRMGYGEISAKDETPDDKNKDTTGVVERKIDVETFSVSGSAKCTYENETIEFAKDFRTKFDTLKSEMDGQNGLLSTIFGRFQEGDNHHVSIKLPNIAFSGKSSIAEKAGSPDVGVKWDYTLKADPLIDIEANADVLPMLIRSSVWGNYFLKLLKELKDRYSNPDGSISAELEASIILSIAGKVEFEFNFVNNEFVTDKEIKPRIFKVEIPFSCEGKAFAKGKIFVFSAEMAVTANLNSGFGYQLAIGEDSTGIYRNSTLAFHGIVFSIIAYIETKVEAPGKKRNDMNNLFKKKSITSTGRKKEYSNKWQWIDPKTYEISKTYIISS